MFGGPSVMGEKKDEEKKNGVLLISKKFFGVASCGL
ncbi:hypothetical protein AA0119_g13358 [Alternaria tenuissima]|uniref:Uncharacterized protein n=2 Tax=Alternaria alternata complex TaxID=187734 RepID=A0A4Q4MMN4_ALTAL|nr:hypothetical protein AA0115_g12391 [Alternaria tenuissima]RYN54203.1 hypothetical protein AA0117_g13329 [Alternaria alternata]RYN85150.1 hypothetical protein AA0119_g13358 [Alternaria tenuissima]RYO00922.1 hypothetical protein AA0121_g13333 [Alternaria tenuissima]RYO48303.1 hypothetical protein AA0116_g12667 [Alternaria tenuissima]